MCTTPVLWWRINSLEDISHCCIRYSLLRSENSEISSMFNEKESCEVVECEEMRLTATICFWWCCCVDWQTERTSYSAFIQWTIYNLVPGSSVQNWGEKCKYVKESGIRLFSRLLEIYFVPLQLYIPGDHNDQHVEMIKYFQLSGCVVCGLGLWTVLDRIKDHSVGLNNLRAAEAGWTCQ